MNQPPPYSDKLLMDFCVRNAIGARALPRCQLRSISAREHVKMIGRRDVKYPAILIPYFDIEGKPVEYFRTVTMQIRANAWQRYLTYQHNARLAERIYFPPILDWQQIAADPKIPIFFYDNEIDAIKACSAGRAAVCDPGLRTWEKREDRGSPRWADARSLCSDDRDFDLIYDQDDGVD
jgi:hypothetical protein